MASMAGRDDLIRCCVYPEEQRDWKWSQMPFSLFMFNAKPNKVTSNRQICTLDYFYLRQLFFFRMSAIKTHLSPNFLKGIGDIP